MAAPSRTTKIKVTVGYTLLLAVLLFSLIFVNREVETLSAFDDQQDLRTDSLLVLLREKDSNTIQMLQILSEGTSGGTFSTGELEELIAEQDSVVTQQRVQHRVITRRDSVLTKPKKKGFFKRLAEAFSPSKSDSAVLLNTAVEFSSDTILEAYHPTDSLQEKLRAVSRQKQRQKKSSLQHGERYQQLNVQLTAGIDSLIQRYEQSTVVRARQEAETQQDVRRRSTNTLGAIAIGAVILSGVFLIFIWRDITRSNRYRRELEEANRRTASLLEAREKLMLTITHDFKAPLGSIIGYADLLSRLTTDGRQRFYLDNMKGSSEHLLKLVSDLLDFHRLDLNKAEVNRITFNPSHLFEEIRVSFQPLAAAKRLTLHCEVSPELDGTFISDPLRIRQIVTNLLSNAVKFTVEGSVGMEVSYVSSRMCIVVSDTGKGLAPSDRERIFQEFTRLPGAQGEEGFGLGLSIVRKLVQLLEGDIEIESTLGEGSRFKVTLPLYPVSLAKEALAETAVEDEPLVSVASDKTLKRVLLIDDDRIQLALTSALLQQQGIQATCCLQPEELIEQLRSESFDLLLTDVQMPAINGFDLLTLLRASNIPQAQTIPVIAVTARSEMEMKEFRAHGFAGVLHKPFSVKELLAVVKGESLDFSALTAFSEDDVEAAKAILRSFAEETGKNRDRMAAALAACDVEGIAAMAHKLLPLLTLIGANETARLLSFLEACRGKAFTDEIAEKTRQVLQQLQAIIKNPALV